MGPVTTNPWLIAIINMTIVFAVLIALGVLMSLIQVVDPTKKKAATPAAAAPAPKAAAAAPKADNGALIAVIAAAVAAAQGCSAEEVAIVRINKATGWTANAFVDAVSARKDSFF